MEVQTWEQRGETPPYPGCPDPTWPRPQYTTAGKQLIEGAYYDGKAADKAVAFIQSMKHTKGRWKGTPLLLEPWQEHEFIRPMFGWKRPEGTRLYRRSFKAIPRKNGKTTEAAAIAGYLLYADGEPGPEVYSAAAERDQAALVFETLKEMVVQEPSLKKRTVPLKFVLSVPSKGGSYKVLSSKSETKHGFNASGIVEDELHVIPRELHEVLTTSIGSRSQPLIVEITTAGVGLHTLCREEWDYAVKVSDGVLPDPSFLGIIYAANEDDDWTSPEVWKAANPNLGVSISLEYITEECQRAKANPAYQNKFRQLHLNQWVAQDVRWIDLRKWDECAGRFDRSDLIGQRCFGGLDLSSTTDLTAFCLVFPDYPDPGHYTVLPHLFIPGEDLREKGLRDKVPYEAWVRDEFLTATQGNAVDQDAVKAAIFRAAADFDLVDVAFDAWGSIKIVQELEAEGVTTAKFIQGMKSFTAPMKELLRLVVEGQFHHSGHPVLRWNANNVTATTDDAGNVKPSKQKSTGRIDGFVATVMALDGAMRGGGVRKTSIYETQGLEVF